MIMKDRVYKKEFSNNSSDQVSELYLHAQRVAATFFGKHDVIFPLPIECTKSSICYEYYDLPASVLDLWRGHRLPLFGFMKIGSALAILHKNGQTYNLLHSDYVLHNLFYGDDKLYIIDAHPPERLPYNANLIYGPSEQDIWWFYLNLISSRPVKISCRNIFQIVRAIKEFKSGYKKNGVYPALDRRSYFFCLSKLFYLRQKAGYSRINVSIYIVVIFVLSFFAVRCAHAYK